MAFLIGGANSEVAGYNIENSLRFDGDSYQSRDPSETGITIKGNFSAWVKFATSNTEVALFGGFDSSGANDNDGYMVFKRTADGNLQFEGGDNVYLETTALFRDTSAWYHIVLAIDSSNATANNKQRIYVNGAEITAFDTRNNLTNLQDLPMNSTAGNDDRFLVGCDEDTGGRGLFFTGYMADVYWIDNNSQMAASDFGEYDDNGVWIPKDGSDISFGDKNSFKMEYGSSGNLGLDTSGLGNSLGDNAGLAATNQTTDTPTNNFATMKVHGSPVVSGAVLAEGNLKCTTGTSGSGRDLGRIFISNILVSSGKWYWEAKMADEVFQIGLSAYQGSRLGSTTNNTRFLVLNPNGTLADKADSSESADTYMAAVDATDIVQFALDMDSTPKVIYFGEGGSWGDGSGNTDESSPNSAVDISGGSHDILTDTTDNSGFIGVSFHSSGGSSTSTAEINFGNPNFSISSGNADGNGYGNFEFAVPSGYYSLNTKNLAKYG